MNKYTEATNNKFIKSLHIGVSINAESNHQLDMYDLKRIVTCEQIQAMNEILIKIITRYKP